LRAADGTRLAAVAVPGPPDAIASVVVVHGFSNSSRTPEIQRLAVGLSSVAHVVALDLRGHGPSGGRSTLGRLEPDDVDAAVAAATEWAPGVPVVAVGVSLGGAASLVAAGRGGALAGVVAVSAPAWADLSSPAGVRLDRWRARPSGRALVRAMSGTRMDPAPEARISPAVAKASRLRSVLLSLARYTGTTPAMRRNGASGRILNSVDLPRNRGYRPSDASSTIPSTNPFTWLATSTTGPPGRCSAPATSMRRKKTRVRSRARRRIVARPAPADAGRRPTPALRALPRPGSGPSAY
jgi:pimeloyl-ACP methyl ester carboxylesterase